MGFFNGLNIFFEWCKDSFANSFNAVPASAQPYLISIVIYALMGTLLFKAKSDGLRWGVVWGGFALFTVLFSIWRLNVLWLLPEVIDLDGVSQVIVFVVGVFLIFGIAWGYYKKNAWVGKLILVLMWAFFLIFTWVVAPLTDEMELSADTLYQTCIVALIFAVPFVLLMLGKAKEGIEKLQEQAQKRKGQGGRC